MNENGSDRAPSVAVVLPGGGARGAYEVGAMAELLPALAARGERVSIICGTSVGAINAALFGSLAGRPPPEQVEVALAHWRSLRKGHVIRRVVGPGLPITLLRGLGGVCEVPGLSLSSLLDAAPLKHSLDRWIDWQELHANVRSGRLQSVCVVATSLERDGPVAFVDTRGALPAQHAADRLSFQRVRIAGEHVRASAAIPLLFPPVEVTAPRAARGQYVDGGTRLNTPIKPAIALGAERVIVIGLEPLTGGARAAEPRHRPQLADVAANVVDGLLVDQVSDDLARMLAINSFFAEHAGGGPSRSALAYRRSRGKPPYRRIAYALVSPERRGAIGAIAERVYERRFGGLRGLRAPDYLLLARVLGGRSRSRGELLSFLLFDELFVDELIEAGRQDARRWLDRHPGFWCRNPAHDFESVSDDQDDVLREAHAIDEWRALNRR